MGESYATYEYLEEGGQDDDVDMLEESESMLDEKLGNDDITEDLRVSSIYKDWFVCMLFY